MGLEKCVQRISATPPEETGAYQATSRPLYELENPTAPEDLLQMPNRFYAPLHPFSNDQSAPYFVQTYARQATHDFQRSPNRVALLIGESSLAPALPFIPEDTILLVDSCADINFYMARYVAALRTLPNAASWQEYMFQNQAPNYAKLERQISHWEAAGATHPLASQDTDATYQKAQALARQKAIIPYNLDITDARELQILGDMLRAHGATLTFMNLSNAIVYRDNFSKGSPYRGVACAELLAQTLPVSPEAPILATSQLQLAAESEEDKIGWSLLGATGPFFGLANLALSGAAIGDTNRSSVECRQYVSPALQEAA